MSLQATKKCPNTLIRNNAEECRYYAQRNTGKVSLGYWYDFIDVSEINCQPTNCFFSILDYVEPALNIDKSEIMSYEDQQFYFNSNQNSPWVFFNIRCVNNAH